ncbi:MAG: hypothetical protein ACR2IA_04320 [Pyrinomonadaceae bacterium]
MTKPLYFWLILLLSTTLFAQNSVELDKHSVIKGQQILKDARKAIGTEKMNLNSFRLKTKSTSFSTRANEMADEINVILPDRIHKIHTVKQPQNFTVTSIWNSEKYKAISETEFFGRRTVIDVTNSSLNSQTLEKLGDKIGKGKVDNFKEFAKIEPKQMFYANIWQVFFSITLIQPFEQKLEFKYIGKAKSANRVANVIDAKSQIGRNYRLLFDSETNHLLMLIETFKSKNGDNENKYYYSNREMVNNVSIPKKIKVEEKFTPTGKEPRISHTSIDVVEFSLNPEFKKSLFDVN